MICVVHGSPAYSVTRPTCSKREPTAAALTCTAGFFTCAQPAIPARAAPAINEYNKNFFIPKRSELLAKRFRKSIYSLLLGVNAMQEAMNKGRQQHRYDADERQPRKESVTRRENFRRVGLQRIDRTHPAENHRRVQKRIDPAQMSDKSIAENAASKPEH